MDNATIVAIVILVGVFALMAITIFKAGIEAAVKLWGVMGALTGVAFGAITSYYFTNKSNQLEIQQAQLQKEAAVLALNNASLKAAEANRFVGNLVLALKGEKTQGNFASTKYLFAIPERERVELAGKAEQASTQLKDIHALKYAIFPRLHKNDADPIQ